MKGRLHDLSKLAASSVMRMKGWWAVVRWPEAYQYISVDM